MPNSKKNQRQPTIDPALLAEFVAACGPEISQEGFTRVPDPIRQVYRQIPGAGEHARMTPTEFLIVADLWPSWWSGDSERVPSIAQLAEHMGISKRQIRRYLHRMEASGWIQIVPRNRADGGQLPNYYDFSPFIRRLTAHLEAEEVSHD
jgi:hypothetical protein